MRKPQSAGFTLTELLVVVAMLSLLAAIIFAAIGPIRRVGRVTTCMSNLRQIGLVYKLYQADYDYYPDPDVVTHGSYLKDKRILLCPADNDPVQLRSASSYRFTYLIWPELSPLPDLREVNPNQVLLSCDHHLGPKLIVLTNNEDPRVTSPDYPFHLVLRADGRVERVHVSRIRQLPMSGDLPTYREVYPGEPGYEQAKR